MTEGEKEFVRFLAEWLEWAEGGAKFHEIFYQGKGLCWNLHKWAITTIKTPAHRWEAVNKLERMLEEEFKDDCDFPFNGGNLCIYNAETNKCLNPQRLAWVRSQLAQAPQGGEAPGRLPETENSPTN